MRFVLSLLIFFSGVASARPNCPVDRRSELPFKLSRDASVERWSKHEFKTVKGQLETIAVITGDPVHFQPACQKQSNAEKLDQARHLSIWIRDENGWRMLAESEETLVPWDQVGEFTTELRWTERTLNIEESGSATRLAMKYTTRIRATGDGQVWQVIGQESLELYNEYRISAMEAQRAFDKAAEKNSTLSPYSGHSNSINWLTGRASIECHAFGEPSKSKSIKFKRETAPQFGSTRFTTRIQEIYKKMQCKLH